MCEVIEQLGQVVLVPALDGELVASDTGLDVQRGENGSRRQIVRQVGLPIGGRP